MFEKWNRRKVRNLFILPAICCALALTLGACGVGKKAALRKAADKAGLIVSKNGKTITGVKNKNMASVDIPDGITTIGEFAFSECNSLTEATIPDSVTSIERYAFYYCSLSDITIPDGVTSIGECTFAFCESLEHVTIPSSVIEIGKSAFDYCCSLRSITIPEGVQYIGKRAFANCSLTSVTIPDSVIIIEEDAFDYCRSLRSITIPDRFSIVEVEKWFGAWGVPSGCKIIRKSGTATETTRYEPPKKNNLQLAPKKIKTYDDVAKESLRREINNLYSIDKENAQKRAAEEASRRSEEENRRIREEIRKIEETRKEAVSDHTPAPVSVTPPRPPRPARVSPPRPPRPARVSPPRPARVSPPRPPRPYR